MVRRWFVGLGVPLLLAACSSTPNFNSEVATTAESVDYLAVEQYKPSLPVVDAATLSDEALAETKSKGDKKVLKEFKFKDGSVTSYITVGDYVVEGDLFLGTIEEFENQLKIKNDKLSSNEPLLSPQGAFLADVRRWPGGIIYVDSAPLTPTFTASQNQDIQDAMNIYNNRTDIKFRLASSGNRIKFTNTNNGCYSNSLGMAGNGVQVVNLADNCFTSANVGTIIHELGHAIGMIHEHNRPERDNYITPSSNLTSYGLSQFQKSGATVWSTYDYPSVMHYPKYTYDTKFVKDPSKPMFTTKGYTGVVRGPGLSNKDVSTVNSAY